MKHFATRLKAARKMLAQESDRRLPKEACDERLQKWGKDADF